MWLGLEFGEAVWEGGADGGEDEDAVFAGEEELDVGVSEGFVFEEGLTAGSAGGYGVGEFVAVGAAGGDCDCEEVGVGVGGVCVVGGGAFGAESGGVGGVFLVGAGDDGAVAEADGCADAEVAVWGVAALGGVAGLGDELLLVGGEFVVVGFDDGGGYVDCFHCGGVVVFWGIFWA